MKSSEIATFTRRITDSNGSELIVVLYDIFFCYTEQAMKSIEELQELKLGTEAYVKADDECKTALRMAGLTLEHLKNALDHKYEIAENLYALYDYAERMVAKTTYSRRIDDIKEAVRIMEGLYSAFQEVAKQDHSDPLMQNAETVAAGLTYGRYDVNEVTSHYDSSRGFFA